MQAYNADNGNNTGYQLHKQKFKAIRHKESKYNYRNDVNEQRKTCIIKCPDNNRYKT